ncbi:unnamed protein product, partial [Rotaria magnacalcarata]
MIYNEVTVQSRFEYLSGNDTNILLASNERFVVDADLRQITIDGSGAPDATETTGTFQNTLTTDIIETSILSGEHTLTSYITDATTSGTDPIITTPIIVTTGTGTDGSTARTGTDGPTIGTGTDGPTMDTGTDGPTTSGSIGTGTTETQTVSTITPDTSSSTVTTESETPSTIIDTISNTGTTETETPSTVIDTIFSTGTIETQTASTIPPDTSSSTGTTETETPSTVIDTISSTGTTEAESPSTITLDSSSSTTTTETQTASTITPDSSSTTSGIATTTTVKTTTDTTASSTDSTSSIKTTENTISEKNETSSKTISSISSGESTRLSTTTPRMTTTRHPNFCKNSSHFLYNDDCKERNTTMENAVNTLKNTTNSTVIADALSVYISAVANTNQTANQNNLLTLTEIDNYVNNMTNVNEPRNNTDSILFAKEPDQGNNVMILGASFTTGVGGEVIDSSNIDSVNRPNITAAAVVDNQSLVGVTSVNMLIIDKPTIYKNVDNKTNKKLASSIIIVTLRRNEATPAPINISLYFKVLLEFQPDRRSNYFCSFYDTNTQAWNEDGCTKPIFKSSLDRYECRCNHTTTFALVWLPKSHLTRYLNSQDIASLVFQSISILCFLTVVLHTILTRIQNPIMSLQTYDLLPLISYAVTMVLFIFFIALAMTTYSTKVYDDETSCFLSSSVLMFFVYFFLIFMFCTKTSVAYFNYLRFVRLFPQPSYRRLFVMLLISFFISLIWVSVAAGLNSNASYDITQLYPYKLCWFTRDVIYYFLTIPVGVFLFLNILMFILVAHRIIKHVRNATSPHQSYERMKQCIIILLLSSATQGIGWLFGPFLTFVDEKAGNILGWFFIIFNGLEGLWIIILYLIIRSQHMDEQKRCIAVAELTKSTAVSS